MHVAIQTALVIPALTIMLTGCQTYRIAGAITARHIAAYLVEHDIETCKDALQMADNLQYLIQGGKYLDGIESPGHRQEFRRRLKNLVTLFIVDDPVLAADARDLYLVLMPEVGQVISYEKVKDVRYMVDAFIEVAERGIRDVSPAQDSKEK